LGWREPEHIRLQGSRALNQHASGRQKAEWVSKAHLKAPFDLTFDDIDRNRREPGRFAAIRERDSEKQRVINTGNEPRRPTDLLIPPL